MDLQSVINELGLDAVADHFADQLLQLIPDQRVFRQFILEELDAAQEGNKAAKEFVRSAGVPYAEYNNSLNRSFPEVDGPNGPQQMLLRIVMSLGADMDKLVALRIRIVQRIMEKAPYKLKNS